LKDEKGLVARPAGMVLYAFWLIVFFLCLATDLVEPGDISLIPFVGRSGPLEKPLRLIGSILILLFIYEIIRLRKQVTGIKKTQLDYFFTGTLIFAGCGVVLVGFLPLLGGFSIDPALGSYFSLPWVALTAYAVTRHRLFGIRHVLSRTAMLVVFLFLAVSMHTVLFKQ